MLLANFTAVKKKLRDREQICRNDTDTEPMIVLFGARILLLNTKLLYLSLRYTCTWRARKIRGTN